MTATGARSAIHSKISSAGDESRDTGRSVLRALRLGLARSAAELFDLSLSVIGATEARCPQDNLRGLLDDTRLLILLDGPEGCTGGLAVDRMALAALIQQQTTGRVTGTMPAERGFTGTDAALVAPLIDGMLTRAADLADRSADRDCLAGFCFGARAEDAQSLALALDADRYRVFDLTVDFAAGAAQGALRLLLPAACARAEAGARPEETGPSLEQVAAAAPAVLNAVISRLRVPLTELAAMQPGDLLALPCAQPGMTELTTITGHPVATGRLGQAGGLRAVRLEDAAPRAAVPSKGSRADPQAVEPHSREFKPGRIGTPPGPSRAPSPPSPAPPPATGPDSDGDSPFAGMTPDEAAAEISMLAGLSVGDTEDPVANGSGRGGRAAEVS